MSVPTVTALRARLSNVIQTAPFVALPVEIVLDQCPPTLPAFVIAARSAPRRDRTGRDLLALTRNFEVLLLVAKVCSSSLAEQAGGA